LTASADAAAGLHLPGDFAPALTMESIVKDLECGIRTSKALGVRLMLAPVAQQLYVEASALGHAQEDLAAVVRPMERIAGVEVRDRASPAPT
jgi:3-hydroxyisobutyrate dehydrogenase-like beta-hydroxyacid dehydrogenase